MNNYIEMKKSEINKNFDTSKKFNQKDDNELIKILYSNNESNIKNKRDKYDEEYEDDIKQISDYINNKKINMEKEKKEQFLREIANIIKENSNNNNYTQNDLYNEDLEDKEIFKQFSEKLNQQKLAQKPKSKNKNKNNIYKKPNLIQNDKKIYNNKIIYENNNETTINENNIYNFNNNENDMKMNELVKDKEKELDKYLKILQNEINNVNMLKNEYEKLNINLNNELDRHERKKEELQKLYSVKKEEEMKKIEKEREILKKEILFTDFPNNSKKNEIIYLKNEIEQIDFEIKNKEDYFKNSLEKLEKEFIETSQINLELKRKLESYEINNNYNKEYNYE